MPKSKVRAGGQVKIPASIVTKYRLREGDAIDIWDTGNGIVFIPQKVKDKKAKQRLFELVEKAWARNRTIDALELDRIINNAVHATRAEERKALNR